MSDDDFDSGGFDSEDDAPPAFSVEQFMKKYPPQRLKFLNSCQFSAQKQFSQNPFDYQKKLSQLIIREQTTTISNQSAETACQTYVPIPDLDKAVQAPESAQFSSLSLLSKINMVGAKKSSFPSDELVQFIKTSLQNQKQSIPNPTINILKHKEMGPKSFAALVQIELNQSEKMGGNDAPDGQNIQQADKINKFEQRQKLMVFAQDQLYNIIQFVKPVDFLTIQDAVYIVNQAGQVEKYKFPSVKSIDATEPLKINQIACSGQRVIGISETNLYQFGSKLADYEQVSVQIKQVFGCSQGLLAVLQDGIQAFDQICELKQQKLMVQGRFDVQCVEDAEGGVKITLKDGSYTVWEGDLDKALVCEVGLARE